MKIVYYSHSPNVNTSYGIQGSMIAKFLAEAGHEVHYVDALSNGGKPYKHENYVIHPGWRAMKGIGKTDMLPTVVNAVRPHVVISQLDIQETNALGQYPRRFVWIGNFPYDIENVETLAVKQAARADIKVFESLDSALRMEKTGMTNVLHIPCVVDTSAYHPIEGGKETICQKCGHVNPGIVDRCVCGEEKKIYKISLDELRAGYGISKDDFVILFVGRPNHRKNYPTIFATIHDLVHVQGLKNVKLLVHTSEDDPAHITDFRQWIKALNLEDNVKFTSFTMWDEGIEKAALNSIYNLGTVYFSPHGGEGFGITQAEAMAVGLPLISTDFTSSREMIGQNERGTCIPWTDSIETTGGVMRPIPDSSVCAMILHTYYDDAKMREEKGKKAREFVMKHYSLDVVKRKWLELVKSCEFRHADGELREL